MTDAASDGGFSGIYSLKDHQENQWLHVLGSKYHIFYFVQLLAQFHYTPKTQIFDGAGGSFFKCKKIAI